MQIVLATHAVGCLADFLHRGQQQADEHGDDRNHHQQLDQREPLLPLADMKHRLPPQKEQ